MWKHDPSSVEYNSGQKNTKLLQRKSEGKFSVFTLSYVNTALNHAINVNLEFTNATL